MMIQSKKDYNDYLAKDNRNYIKVSGNAGIKDWLENRFLSSPISDQSKIWRYIKTLRKCEYWHNTGTVLGGANLSIYGISIN